MENVIFQTQAAQAAGSNSFKSRKPSGKQARCLQTGHDQRHASGGKIFVKASIL